MSTKHKNLSSYDAENLASANPFKFAIIVADWNKNITHSLYEGCYETLIQHGAKAEQVYTAQVPGTFELPAAARMLYQKHSPDAVICLGCVIKGETSHNEYINQSVAQALQQMSITTGKSFIFGVLTPNTMEQALDRAGGKYGNKGVEAAVTAIRMAALKQDLSNDKKTIGF